VLAVAFVFGTTVLVADVLGADTGGGGAQAAAAATPAG
jgi:hypothetical protein